MLTKEYTICGTKIKLKNSAYLNKMYRAMYNRDLIEDVNTVFTSKERNAAYSETIENIAYAMALHADENIGSQQDFLELFDSAMFLLQIIQPIMDLWVEGAHMLTEPAKKKEQPHDHTTEQSST